MENSQEPDDHKNKPKQENSSDDRRGGMDRRWIKSDYNGPERRSSKDRRDKKSEKNGDFDPSRL